MPLIKGSSQKSFVKNLKTEMEHGKPQKQSLAIAYAMKRKAAKKKMAMGGFLAEEKASGFLDHEGNTQRPNEMAVSEDERKLGQHGAKEQGPIPAPHENEYDMVDRIMNKKSEDLSSLDRYAMGGELAGHIGNEGYVDDEQDMVDRIMYKRSKDFSDLDRYSEGGKVANQDETTAGFSPNEFDDLHLRDDLSSSYGEDDNSGDALGNDQEDEDRKDIVARIMASRRKKDRLPSPA